jgi:electron transport complex protein RnfB
MQPTSPNAATDKVFKRLAKHLDNLPGGFPPTESGVELRILRHLFTPEEAAMAVKLTLIPEFPEVTARRAKRGVEETGTMLEDMASKGLIMRVGMKKPFRYMAAQFVVGIWEYQVNRLTEELVRDFNEYAPILTTKAEWDKVPQVRVVPVEKSITPEHQAMPYEEAQEIIKTRRKILVAPCICRREHKMVGEGCGKLEEACLIFDWSAVYYQKNKVGRIIDADEALAILAEGDKQGLVLQPSNGKKPAAICMCCGCCCQVFLAYKRHPDPAKFAASPFTIKLDDDKCIGCSKCVKRCQMDAFTMVEDEAVPKTEKRATVDKRLCIGCGLCVTTCPTEALELVRKEDAPKVPESFPEALMNLGRARGKLSPTKMALTMLKSKMDRILASRK